MLSSRKKDKNYRAVVQKFEIKRLQAKVFSQDLSLRNRLSYLEKKISSLLLRSPKVVALRPSPEVIETRALQTTITKTEQEKISFSRRTTLLSSFQSADLFLSLPRNSSKTRVKNRCIESGRSRSVLRFCKLSRILLREKASKGAIPGVIKASW